MKHGKKPAKTAMDAAQDFIHQSCDSYEVADLLSLDEGNPTDHDTSDGEEFLEDCGGIAQEGDSFWSNRLPHCLCDAILCSD